jgi:hypothetical protein
MHAMAMYAPTRRRRTVLPLDPDKLGISAGLTAAWLLLCWAVVQAWDLPLALFRATVFFMGVYTAIFFFVEYLRRHATRLKAQRDAEAKEARRLRREEADQAAEEAAAARTAAFASTQPVPEPIPAEEVPEASV